MSKVKNQINLTLYFDGRFYVALLERQQEKLISLAKHIFGAEPSDAELYEFVLHEIQNLHFTNPEQIAEYTVARCRINYKRMLRQVKKELKNNKLKKETLAQEQIRLQLERNAKMKRKSLSKIVKKENKRDKFILKQLKKKNKMRGK